MIRKVPIIPLLLSLLCFFLYLHNLSRSVYGGDVGDFVTNAYLHGLPHAPGYPLFTFLGFLITRFSFFPSPAYAVGIISVFSGSLSVFFFYLLIKKLTKKPLLTLLTTTILAFSFLFWFYNEIAEVFALNNFFAILLFYLAVSLYQKPRTWLLLLLSFFLGLAATHHQTIALIYPSLFFMIGAAYWKKKKELLLHLPFVLLASLCGFFPYVYAFVSTPPHMPIMWDRVYNFSSLLHLVLRKDYGTFSGGIFAQPTFMQRFVILRTYGFTLLSQLTIPVILTSCLGVYVLYKKNKIFFIAFFLAFLLSGPFFITYAGFPLFGAFYVGIYERFFILSSILVLFFFPFGLEAISSFFVTLFHRSLWKVAIPLVFLLIPLSLLVYNYPKTNLFNVMIGDTFAKDLIFPLPQHAVIFLGGDTTLFNTWYVHYVLHVRPDVQVVNLDGLYRDDYFMQQKLAYEKKYGSIKPNLVTSVLMRYIQKSRPVFAISSLQPTGGKKDFVWIPYGLDYQLVKPGETSPGQTDFTQTMQRVWQSLTIPSPREHNTDKSAASLSITDLPLDYSFAMMTTGNYYLTQYKNVPAAKYWYDWALHISPQDAEVHRVLGIYYYTAKRQCSLASDEFNQAIALDPLDRLSYFLLHKVDTDCLHDRNATLSLEQKFKQVFYIDYQKAFTNTMKAK